MKKLGELDHGQLAQSSARGADGLTPFEPVVLSPQSCARSSPGSRAAASSVGRAWFLQLGSDLHRALSRNSRRMRRWARPRVWSVDWRDVRQWSG